MSRIFNLSYLKQKRRELRNNPTDPEKYLWYELKGKKLNGIKFRRQYSIGNYIADFYSTSERLVIELDGAQHEEEGQKVYDSRRTEYFHSLGIRVIRFKNTDVIYNRDKVVEVIVRELCKSNS